MNDCTVLLFHSIDERELDSFRSLGNIHPELFQQAVMSLRKNFDLVSIKDLVDCIKHGTGSRQRLLSLSFDDGSKSYAARVVPILEQLKIPSACFLITDCIGDNALYWRYLYNYCINRGYARRLADLIQNEYQETVSEEGIISFTRKRFSPAKNKNIMKNIFREIVSEEEYRNSENSIFMPLDDIKTLKNSQLVTFGIHTATHPVMMHLSNDEIEAEISSSMKFYQEHVGDGVPVFSIPFGRLYKDYDERTVKTALSLSINTVFSAYGGSNRKGQPPYNIRRVPVNEDLLRGGVGRLLTILDSCPVAPDYALKEQRLYKAIGF